MKKKPLINQKHKKQAKKPETLEINKIDLKNLNIASLLQQGKITREDYKRLFGEMDVICKKEII